MNVASLLQGLDEAHIRYVLVGGFALQLHGFQRATYDIDIALAMDEDNLSRFIEVALRLSLIPVMPVPLDSLKNAALIDQWHREKGMLAFALREAAPGGLVIDLLVKPEVRFAELAKRANKVTLLGHMVPIASIDDLITMKRVAARPKDQIDIMALEKIKRGENPNE